MKVEYKAAVAVTSLVIAILVTVLLYFKFGKGDESDSSKKTVKSSQTSPESTEGKTPEATGNNPLVLDDKVTNVVQVEDKKDSNGVQADGVTGKQPGQVTLIQSVSADSKNTDFEKVENVVPKPIEKKGLSKGAKPQTEVIIKDDAIKEQTLTPKSVATPAVINLSNLKTDANKEKTAKQSLLDQNKFLKTCSPHFNSPEFSTPYKVPRANCATALQQDPDRFIKSPSSNTAVTASPEFIDRLQGVAWAALAGDAFGAAVEFKSPAEVLSVFPLDRKPIDYDENIWQPNWKGLWTDDSTSALCLAAAYIKSRSLDCKTHFETLKRWRTEEYMYVIVDIGDSSKDALDNNEIRKASSTNGCIMRMWPNVFFHSLHPIEDAVDASAASALLTHVHTVCRDSSRLMAAIIWDLLHGAKKEHIFSPNYKQQHAKLWADRPFSTITGKNVADLLENPASANFPAGPANYEADEALRIALEAFRETDNLLDGFLYCVRKGADTDTTATIYGQIAGAYYGKSHIVKNFPWMIERLYAKPALEQLIDAMTMIAQNHYAELPKMDIFDNNGDVISFNMAHLGKELQCSVDPPYWLKKN